MYVCKKKLYTYYVYDNCYYFYFSHVHALFYFPYSKNVEEPQPSTKSID